MNVHEAQELRAILTRSGLIETQSNDEADILIFHTCCIRDTAEQKVISHIGEACKIKKEKPNILIAVMGCLGAKNNNQLKKKFPNIDIILGTNQVKELSAFLGAGDTSIFGLSDTNSIVITHGCENFCSYCIVPYVRGKEYSRNSVDIENEFLALKDKNEIIWLLGQNVNSYKCPQTGINFVELLDRLCKIKGDYKINFLSSHPKDFSEELVNCIARNPNIERSIHLPLQSGSNKILQAMNRNYTVEQYCEKIKLLRDRVPNVHITTDIICGFPGETEKDFEDTINIMKQLKFNAAFIFPYSKRSGTKADAMPNHLDTKTRKLRATELIELQRKIAGSL